MATRKIKRKSRTSRKSTRRKSTRRKSTHRKSRKKKCIQKWKTLEHNGVIFPEPYQHLSIPLLYGPGKKSIMLNAEAEEAAMFYAKILHLDHTTNPTFRKNFFADWKKLLPRGTEIKSLDQCDFKNFRDIVDDEATQRKAITKSKKARSKSEKETSEAKYKIALVDGKKQSVGNFRVEPSGLFLGRGKHPKAGLIKKRIRPEDIILNIGELAAIPKPPKGHEWGEIIHDHCVEWLASWKENINNDTKYVWLGHDADFKATSDEAKFALAKELKDNFDSLRERNMINIMTIGSSKEADRLNQLAVAVYLIDTLVLRVGNEKGADEADTVGVSSLRAEHIKLKHPDTVELDFLGKDSVRFNKTFKVPQGVYRLLKFFTQGKDKSDALFNMINAKDINQYLKELMPGLTAKVFRTANASNLFQTELDKIKVKRGEKPAILINRMNKANAEVAIMCNHKKKAARGYETGLEKIKDTIKTAEDKLKELKSKRKSRTTDTQIKNKKDKIKELKSKLDTKKHMKDVATGTAKINYIDPRITVVFAKKHNIDISKVFNKQQQKKFAWAMNADVKWKF
jgi:DNA topoisomerase-1